MQLNTTLSPSLVQEFIGRRRSSTPAPGVAADGSVTIAAGNANDGETVALRDALGVDVTFEFDTTMVFATGDVTIAVGNAVDTDLVTLIDALGTSVTFEFESTGGVTAGNIAVTVGGSEDLSRDNLEAAINAQANLRITASDGGVGIVDLVQLDAGVSGNTVIVETGGDISANDFASGVDPVVAAGNVPVQVGGSADVSRDNLELVINEETDLAITGSDGGVGIVDLVQDIAGASGNTTITEDGTDISAVSFASGTGLVPFENILIVERIGANGDILCIVQNESQTESIQIQVQAGDQNTEADYDLLLDLQINGVAVSSVTALPATSVTFIIPGPGIGGQGAGAAQQGGVDEGQQEVSVLPRYLRFLTPEDLRAQGALSVSYAGGTLERRSLFP